MQTYNRYKSLFIAAYLDCAKWSSGEEFDNAQLSEEARQVLTGNAALFFDNNKDLIEEFVWASDSHYAQAGHSCWLSSNGHGAGYFDFSDNVAAQELQTLSEQSKGFNLYIGDDGLVYV